MDAKRLSLFKVSLRRADNCVLYFDSWLGPKRNIVCGEKYQFFLYFSSSANNYLACWNCKRHSRRWGQGSLALRSMMLEREAADVVSFFTPTATPSPPHPHSETSGKRIGSKPDYFNFISLNLNEALFSPKLRAVCWGRF